ncbi:MAG: chemotaxis protein CheW [Planctomycetota bacterium]
MASDPQTETISSGTADVTGDDILQLVSFEIGTEEYAIPILAVQEINRMMAITRVPNSPPSVEGVINLRGRIIPVIDLRQRFGLTACENNADTRIIVVEVGALGRVIGFMVDRVNQVLRLSRDIVDPAPSVAGAANADFIQGVGKLDDRLLILLDLERLFGDQELPDCEAPVAQAA